MATGSSGQGGSQEPPAASADGLDVPGGLFALFGVVAMWALALSIVAIVVAGGRDDERPTAGGGPVKTLAVELGDLFVRPDRVEVGWHTADGGGDQHGDQEHDLILNGEIGTDRLRPGESQTADLWV